MASHLATLLEKLSVSANEPIKHTLGMADVFCCVCYCLRLLMSTITLLLYVMSEFSCVGHARPNHTHHSKNL